MKDTDASLIDRLGGTEAVAEALGMKVATVKKWRQKKRGIPWNLRGKVQKLAREQRKRLPTDFLNVRVAA